ncbi:MAG: ABC transporter ATP-binding protein [Deltaproteobacteria bacterium]|nr:ABC transporter ATP-binding protein [Deltaproteobacteria bacterium]
MNHKQVDALKDITFDISQGELLTIVGASGAGKSTLLHILGTLDHPTSGELLYRGENLFSLREKELAAFRNYKIGFIFQFHYLLPEFTALENTMLPALVRGYRKDSAIEEAEKILVDVGLKDRLTHKQGELSGGEQQRVAVARALILKPEIILADEPTGNLDSKTGEAIFDMLLSLNQQLKITLLVVTHNESIASKMPRRITLIDGQVAIQ